MNKLKRKFGALPLALVLVVLCGAAVFAQKQLAVHSAQGRPEVKVMLDGTVERNGSLVALERANADKPGEVLHWNLTSTNEGRGAAHDYKAVRHIPNGTSFVQASATSEHVSTVTYSIDGGKTFSTLPVVEERQPDGSTRKVPAPVSMYTEVRYEWNDQLAAGGKLEASYKVRVK